MPAVNHRIELLADLFLGAAFADHRFAEAERRYITQLLLDLLCQQELPDSLRRRIEQFDPAAFNLEQATADFLADPPMSRRRLVELVAYVSLSDGEMHMAEDRYLRRLANALGLAKSDYEDLTLDADRIRESFTDLARIPVPNPRTASRVL